MSATKILGELDTLADSPLGLAVLLAVAGGIVYYAYTTIKHDAGAALDEANGLLSGNNATTQGAVDAQGNPVSAYVGAGILGTLGAESNKVSGGWFASEGEQLGDWLFDTFQAPSSNGGAIPTSNQSGEVSDSIQSSSNRPYQNGPNAAYMDAVNDSPVLPQYAATALNGDNSIDNSGDIAQWDND